MFLAAVLYGAVAAVVTPARAQTETDEEQDSPHIAALLPLKSKTFLRYAEAVRRGIAAAATAEVDRPNTLPVVVYPTGDDAKEVVDTYDLAIRRGARFVIGPLTKNAVQAVAKSYAVSVPTLALSVPDGDFTLPDGLYAFGIQMEAEARQVARVAASTGKRRVAIFVSDNALSKRVGQAFAEEWARSGRLVVDQYTHTTDAARLKRIRDAIAAGQVDVIFFALDGPKARQIRPYLGKTLPAFGTSQIYSPESHVLGQHDLNGIVFVDMPWLVSPDHPAVMTYERQPGNAATFELERFYALGIDAWRLAHTLLDGSYNDMGMLDGVSGYLSPGPARVFNREGAVVQFTQSGLRPFEISGSR